MGIYASIAKNDPALAALLRETAAATVNRKPGIDCSLVHDGLRFATHGDRCRYVGTSSAEKAHWLEQNKGRYQPIEDVQQEPQLGSPDHVGMAPTGPSTAAPTRETEGPQTQATPFGDPGRKRGRRDRSQLDKQKFPARNPEVVRKRSPERMRMVIDALRENPTLGRAAAKAGIHHKTLAYWLKCSAAGHDGYDIEWQGEQWRFHEHCEAVIAEADDTLHFLVWQMAMGIKFKTDPSLVKLGYQGVDAYAKDENGDFIEEGVRRPNLKMMRFYLAWKRPETWGKHPKRDICRTGGVLVVGGRSGKSENSYAGSIRARKWKAISRKVQVPKA
jgi:hypothetical protein